MRELNNPVFYMSRDTARELWKTLHNDSVVDFTGEVKFLGLTVLFDDNLPIGVMQLEEKP